MFGTHSFRDMNGNIVATQFNNIGATLGSRLLGRLQSLVIRIVFVLVLLGVSLEMLLKGLR